MDTQEQKAWLLVNARLLKEVNPILLGIEARMTDSSDGGFLNDFDRQEYWKYYNKLQNACVLFGFDGLNKESQELILRNVDYVPEY